MKTWQCCRGGGREAHRGPWQQDRDRDREVAGEPCGGINALHFPFAAAEYLRDGEEGKRAFSGCMEGSVPLHAAAPAALLSRLTGRLHWAGSKW